jgi:hypothetical protein
MNKQPWSKHRSAIYWLKAANRFWSNVNKTDTYWLWTGPTMLSGYGYFAFGRDWKSAAHRLTYELFKGPIPEKLQLDHLCRNRLCVNPEHLESVTLKTNVLRGVGTTAVNARKTHCIHGHPLSRANTYISPTGHRSCRICNWERGRRHLKDHGTNKPTIAA